MKTEYTEEQKQAVIQMFKDVGISKTLQHYKGQIGQYTIRCWCVPGWKVQQETKVKEYRETVHSNTGKRKYSTDFKTEVRNFYIQNGIDATVKKYRDTVW